LRASSFPQKIDVMSLHVAFVHFLRNVAISRSTSAPSQIPEVGCWASHSAPSNHRAHVANLHPPQQKQAVPDEHEHLIFFRRNSSKNIPKISWRYVCTIPVLPRRLRTTTTGADQGITAFGNSINCDHTSVPLQLSNT
jgi:hypothetical protein